MQNDQTSLQNEIKLTFHVMILTVWLAPHSITKVWEPHIILCNGNQLHTKLPLTTLRHTCLYSYSFYSNTPVHLYILYQSKVQVHRMGVSGERVPPTLKSVGLTRDRIYENEWWGDGMKWNCNNRVKLSLRP